jgi:hypothetical protein
LRYAINHRYDPLRLAGRLYGLAIWKGPISEKEVGFF